MKPRPLTTLCMLLAIGGGTGKTFAEGRNPAPADAVIMDITVIPAAAPGAATPVDDVTVVEVEAIEAQPGAPGAPAVPAEAREFKIKLARPAQPGEFNVPVPVSRPLPGGMTPAPRVLFHRIAAPAPGAAAGAPGMMPTRLTFPPTRALFLAEPGAGAGLGAPAGDFFYVAGKVEMKKVAYLGVSTSPVAAALASHLKLPEGFGLIVDHAQADEPAAKAGLKPHDVIIRIGDQKLVNAQQLGTLVRAQKPGDEIDLTIIREGKEMTVKAKLVEKEMPLHAMSGDPMMGIIGGSFAPETLMPMEMTPAWVDSFQPHEIVRTRGSMRYADDEHQLEVQHVKDGLKLIAMDKAGKEIFSGPVTTEEDRKKVPAPIRAKLDKLDKSTRVIIEHSAEIEPGIGVGRGPGPGTTIDVDKGIDIDAIKTLIDVNLKGLKLEGAQQEQLKKQLDELKKQLDEMKAKAGTPADFSAGSGIASFDTTSAVVSMNDGEHQISVKTNAKGKFLTAKDKDGKEIFSGPINSDEQLKKVPAEIREKLEMMERATRTPIGLSPSGDTGGSAPQPPKGTTKE
jgi:hypothetical protein